MSFLIVLLLASPAAAAAAAALRWTPGVPTGWAAAPGAITAFPYDANQGEYTADPWNYTQRLGMYKTLLGEATALQAFVGGAFGNPLWGLPLQFSWQHDTGRLLQGGENGTARINATSWWGGMNYMLSAVPFIAGLEAGVVDVPEGATVVVLAPAAGDADGADGGADASRRFCTSFSDCMALAPNATRNWFEFFQRVKASAAPTPPSAAITLNESIALLWHGHIASLHEGLPLMRPLLDKLPSGQESRFGVAWANLVDFVAALQFDVNFNNTNFLQGMIVPPRLLREDDKAPFIHDFTPAQNRALLVASVFNAANKATHGELLKLFRDRACCTAKGRSDAYGAMIALLEGKGLLTVADVIKLVWDLVKSHPCPHGDQNQNDDITATAAATGGGGGGGGGGGDDRTRPPAYANNNAIILKNNTIDAAASTCFVDPVYNDADIVVTSGIPYGSNFNVMTQKNQTLTLDLYTPPDSDKRTMRPAFVLVHGGSFETGDSTSDGEPDFARVLATRGFVVVSINYRLTGAYYGLTKEQPALDAAEDARAAIRFVRKHAAYARVDTDRISIGGDSAGAVTSLYVGYVKAASSEGHSGNPGFSSQVRAIVSVSGELRSEAFCKGLYPDGTPYDCAVNGTLNKVSDIDRASLPPLAMVHGTLDLTVPYANAKAVIEQANKVGLLNTLVTIPGAKHVPFHELFTESTYLPDLMTFLVQAMDLKDAQCPIV
jgi:acetyl esterase/lipase